MAGIYKNTFMKGKKKYFRLKLVVALMCSFSLFFFFYAGAFLAINQSPQEVDVIIVLSGEDGRVEKAVELYRDGYAPNIILSNATESAGELGNMLQAALALGVDREDIITENSARSTYQNAENTLPIMKNRGFVSAIIVSSDYHMRRVRFNFGRCYKGSGIKLIYIGASSKYRANRWWADHYSIETTFNEYVKVAGNMFGYDGPQAKQILRRIKAWFK
ncbi:uncharacterized SAM-binding protein YcdF (DUF218 family) [Paenibacillus forsythiae]|uniref:Uncharacterized SAM-binding protein YcdF (DUF218 family) n=1 Tax=Paenibacillus forsythiae TaxID=365616 RepID=A0ABU3HDI2_9BACL|nr:YdcF family protein [Paenibacillus forsythiae]MDT3428872.1 uncharacterized SAM-binding protein YcdF (DUF218 family) [Paenibacillus forsythiae]